MARLSNSSARFFLSLVLSRSVETSLKQAEFAIRPERGGFVPQVDYRLQYTAEEHDRKPETQPKPSINKMV